MTSTILPRMNKQDWSEVCGFMSLGFSSFFWIERLLQLVVAIPHFEFSFYFFLAQWILAAALALIAAALGSPRWAYAVLLPILNWLASYYLPGG
jgi:hypothetical protein